MKAKQQQQSEIHLPCDFPNEIKMETLHQLDCLPIQR